MDEDLAEVYNINKDPEEKNEGANASIPDWLRPIMMNENVQKIWMKLSKLTLIVNIVLLLIFFIILIYNIIVQLFMIPELLGPIYVIAPIIILFFCFFHSLLGLGWLNALTYLALVIVGSWIWEEIGVVSGIIFGKYHYSDLLPAKISKVPIEVPFSWFIFLYISFCLADIIVNGKLHTRTKENMPKKIKILSSILLSITTGIINVGWDMAADPMGSIRCSSWIWEHDNGYYFGVPALNFFGWFWITALFTFIYLVIEHFIPLKPVHSLSIPHALCPVILYCGFIVYYVLLSEPQELGFIALFTMGFPVFLVIIRMIYVLIKPKLMQPKEGYDPILEASKSYDDFYQSF